MKPTKMFGLAVLTALIAIASGSASVAMAENTVLCTADETPCAEENIIEHTHLVSREPVKLLNGVTVECDVLFLGTVEAGWFGRLIKKGSYTISNCTNGCTVNEENGPTEFEVLREGTELASVTASTGAGAGLLHVVCFGFINCRYVLSGLVGHSLGPLTSSEENGSVTYSEQTLSRESGSLCPSTTKLDLTTTPLVATYISN